MRIRLWNAFASNNSGSYTLVGTFQTRERAVEVARVLAPLLAEQTRWRDSGEGRPSPLERLALAEMLAWDGDSEDWPEYANDITPRVVALGTQVLLHHEYTETLPHFFGHFFYARGGRVDTTLDHAHHPVVAEFEIWWAWDAETRARTPELRRALAAALEDPRGPLASTAKSGVAPLVRAAAHSPFLVAAVFEDLVAGTAAVQQTIERHEGHSRLRISEAYDAGDPLAQVRLASR